MSLAILVLGTIINSIVISSLIKLYQSSKLCDLDPECMDESGIGFINLGTFSDLIVWSVMSLAFGLVFIIGSALMKKPKELSNEN